MSLIFCSSVLSCSYLIQFILPDDQGCQPLFSLGREESGCGAPPSKRPGRVPRPPASVTSLRGAIEVIVRGSGNLGLRLSSLWQIKRAERGPHTLEPFCLLPFWKGRIMCIFARFSVAFHAKIGPAVAFFHGFPRKHGLCSDSRYYEGATIFGILDLSDSCFCSGGHATVVHLTRT